MKTLEAQVGQFLLGKPSASASSLTQSPQVQSVVPSLYGLKSTANYVSKFCATKL